MKTPMQQHIIKCFALIAAMIFSQQMFAQTDVQFTQYYEVPSVYNPAAIGNTDCIRVRAGGRMQWVGIDNAPQGLALTGDMPLKLFGKRFGVGLSLQQESAGLFNNLSVSAQVGYKLKLFKGELTAGLQIGYVNEKFRGSEVFIPDDDDYHESTDDAIPQTDLSGGALDLGVGVYYTHKWFWAGLSATHLTAPTITFTNETGSIGNTGSSTFGTRSDASTGEGEIGKKYEFQLRRTLYFMAGSNISIKNTLFEIMPSLLVKSDFTFTRVEATARARWKKLITFGVGYRHDDAIYAVLGAEYKGFFLGYSYDYPITAISKASHGSHELFLGYSIKLNLSGTNNYKHKSIRIM